jgi:hypothetical protein
VLRGDLGFQRNQGTNSAVLRAIVRGRLEFGPPRFGKAAAYRPFSDILPGRCFGWGACPPPAGKDLHRATQTGPLQWSRLVDADLRRDQGKSQQARELLAQIYGWFTKGFDTLDLKEAKAPLDDSVA